MKTFPRVSFFALKTTNVLKNRAEFFPLTERGHMQSNNVSIGVRDAWSTDSRNAKGEGIWVSPVRTGSSGGFPATLTHPRRLCSDAGQRPNFKFPDSRSATQGPM